eukprot:10558019-Alexandrium_andersonii.AAC.1
MAPASSGRHKRVALSDMAGCYCAARRAGCDVAEPGEDQRRPCGAGMRAIVSLLATGAPGLIPCLVVLLLVLGAA